MRCTHATRSSIRATRGSEDAQICARMCSHDGEREAPPAHLLSGLGAVLHLLEQFGRVVRQLFRVAARFEVRPDCERSH